MSIDILSRAGISVNIQNALNTCILFIRHILKKIDTRHLNFIAVCCAAFFLPHSKALTNIFLGLSFLLWVYNLSTGRAKWKAPSISKIPAIFLFFMLLSVSTSKNVPVSVKFLPFYLKMAIPYILLSIIISMRELKIVIYLLLISMPLSIIGSGLQYFGGVERLSGFLGFYGTYAEILQLIGAICFAFTIVCLCHKSPRAYIFGTFFLINLLLLSLTLTRSALLAFLLSMILISALSPVPLKKKLLGLVLIFVIGSSFYVFLGRKRGIDSIRFRDMSSQRRRIMLAVGAEMVKDNVFFGVGPDCTKFEYRRYVPQGVQMRWEGHLHSTYLELPAQSGFPALLSFLAIYCSIWYACFKIYRNASAGGIFGSALSLGILGGLTGFGASGIVNCNFFDSQVAALFWFLTGIVFVLKEHKSKVFSK